MHLYETTYVNDGYKFVAAGYIVFCVSSGVIWGCGKTYASARADARASMRDSDNGHDSILRQYGPDDLRYEPATAAAIAAVRESGAEAIQEIDDIGQGGWDTLENIRKFVD